MSTYLINDEREDIKEYLSKKENRNASESENNFANSIKGEIASLEGFPWDNKFFQLLKNLDELLFGEKGYGRTEKTGYGYLSGDEVEALLKYLYIQRYINAHDEDEKDEKIKEATLHDFISDKYDSGVHFFEEILQNIDDAIGRADKFSQNTVEITWIGDEIQFEYPDRGFSFYDLMAITSLGNSIKKGDIEQASIGEKGIGFKSVFSVATNINIKSRFFSFDITYDTKRKTSVLQPSRITGDGTQRECTILTISFNQKFNIGGEEGFKKQLEKWLFDNRKDEYLHYSPFLFLKHVTDIKYQEDQKEPKEIAIRREPIEGEEKVSFISIGKSKYFVYRYDVAFSRSFIENRWGKIAAIEGKSDDFSINRPIEIAFPIIDNEEVITEGKGVFYSYLPTEMVIDFPIYINVDVHLKSSRGRISEADFKDGSQWNQHIKDELAGSLKAAFEKIKELYSKKESDCYTNIRSIAERLYMYIGKQETNHYFTDELITFYEDMIKEPYYLDIRGEFVEKDGIWYPSLAKHTAKEDWRNITEFCLGLPLPSFKKQYLFNYGWYDFYDRVWKGEGRDFDWKAFLLNQYAGVKEFYGKSMLSQKDKNRIVLWILGNSPFMNHPVKNHPEWNILFIEHGKDYQIANKKELDAIGKVVFFHGDYDTEMSDELSVYISRNVFDEEDYKKYSEILAGLVDKKDWKGYLQNRLNEISQKEVEVYSCFNDTFKYAKLIDDCSKVAVPDGIRQVFSKYVLPSGIWDSYKAEEIIVYRKEIARKIESYMEKDQDNYLGYKILDLTQIEYADKNDKNKMIDYLIQLGMKAEPEVKEGSFDPLTISIMPDYTGITARQNELRFQYPGEGEKLLLQKYLVEYANDRRHFCTNFECFKKNGINFDNFIFISDDIVSGMNLLIDAKGKRGGMKQYPYGTTSFKKLAEEDYRSFYTQEGKSELTVNSGQIKMVSTVAYFAMAKAQKESTFHTNYSLKQDVYDQNERYDDNNNKLIKRIINSPPDTDVLDCLRWINIWNKVFGVFYRYTNEYIMTVENFISCCEFIGRDDIDKLFEKGYTIKWDEQSKTDHLFHNELVEYISNELGIEIESGIEKKYYCHIQDVDNERLIPLTKAKYTKWNNAGEYEAIVCVNRDSKHLKTDYVCQILKNRGVIVNQEQKLEIQDIVGEITQKNPGKLLELRNTDSVFSSAIFRNPDNREKYDGILSEIKNRLPSVWKKSTGNKKEDWGIKEWLCESFRTSGYVFQGYGYQCPICGSVAHHRSISGMKYIRRIKNADYESKETLPYLYLISCLNCADMIERAEKVTIKDFDNSPLTAVLEHLEKVCYCSDNEHVYNHSKMKTMKLYLEIDGHEIVENIKMSFLHLVLFLKLKKSEDNQ